MIVVLVCNSFHLLQVVITALETTCYYFKSFFFFFWPSRLQNLKLMFLIHLQKVLDHSIIFHFTKVPKILIKIETFKWIV